MRDRGQLTRQNQYEEPRMASNMAQELKRSLQLRKQISGWAAVRRTSSDA